MREILGRERERERYVGEHYPTLRAHQPCVCFDWGVAFKLVKQIVSHKIPFHRVFMKSQPFYFKG